MNGNVACPGCGLHFEFSIDEHDLTPDISEDEQETVSPSSSIKSREKKIQWTTEGRSSKRAKIDADESTDVKR